MTYAVVGAEIDSLRVKDVEEYNALKKIVRERGRGGIPLALLHAGSYIQQHGISFLYYYKLYENMRLIDNLKPVMHENNAWGIAHDELREIWTT